MEKNYVHLFSHLVEAHAQGGVAPSCSRVAVHRTVGVDSLQHHQYLPRTGSKRAGFRADEISVVHALEGLYFKHKINRDKIVTQLQSTASAGVE